MKVRFLIDTEVHKPGFTMANRLVFKKGEVTDTSPHEAETWASLGIAELVTAPERPTKKKATETVETAAAAPAPETREGWWGKKSPSDEAEGPKTKPDKEST